MPYTYEYPRPALTVDCVVFGLDGSGLKLLLVRRGVEPFKGRWALPGGFVEEHETTDQAARRELAEEAGLSDLCLEQLHTFSAIDRDPRHRTVTVAHCALVRPGSVRPAAGDDAAEVDWFDARRHPPLAFDHEEIKEMALARLARRLRDQPIGIELLPQEFTLPELQRLYELVLGRELDESRFREVFLQAGILAEGGEPSASTRSPTLYRFDEVAYARLIERGFHFEL